MRTAQIGPDLRLSWVVSDFLCSQRVTREFLIDFRDSGISLKLEAHGLKTDSHDLFSFLPKKDPESSLLELIFSRVDILPC